MLVRCGGARTLNKVGGVLGSLDVKDIGDASSIYDI